LDDFVVPETQYRITLTTQPRISMLVICNLFNMLHTVNFNNPKPDKPEQKS